MLVAAAGSNYPDYTCILCTGDPTASYCAQAILLLSPGRSLSDEMSKVCHNRNWEFVEWGNCHNKIRIVESATPLPPERGFRIASAFSELWPRLGEGGGWPWPVIEDNWKHSFSFPFILLAITLAPAADNQGSLQGAVQPLILHCVQTRSNCQ